MRIPRQFTLGGVDWKVEIKADLVNALGATWNDKALIHIHKDLPKQVQEQTFFHELGHAILFSMGKPSSEHDEVFVDGFATLLHQALTTAK